MLAEVCDVDRERIESLRADKDTFVEYTFLHREYRRMLDTESAAAKVRLTLDCIYTFVEWTHWSWSKRKVSAGGAVSQSFSMLSQDIGALTAFVDFIDYQTSHTTADQQLAVKFVLDCLESVWSMPVPDRVDEYLEVRCRTLRECLGS